MADFACVTDGYGVRVYKDFWSDDPVDVAAEYAEFCDESGAEGPQERVVFVRDLDDPNAKIIAVSVEYEMQPVYSGTESDDQPSDDDIKELGAESTIIR